MPNEDDIDTSIRKLTRFRRTNRRLLIGLGAACFALVLGAGIAAGFLLAISSGQTDALAVSNDKLRSQFILCRTYTELPRPDECKTPAAPAASEVIATATPAPVRGIAGEDGGRGRPGQNGTNGTSGTSGTSGTDGVGKDGSPGASGASGIPGQGIDGTSGTSGTSGVDGQDGKDGQDGAPGSAGPPGPTCPDGYSAQAVPVDHDDNPVTPKVTGYMCMPN